MKKLGTAVFLLMGIFLCAVTGGVMAQTSTSVVKRGQAKAKQLRPSATGYLRFSHEGHVRFGCGACHVSGEASVYRMDRCYRCHQSQESPRQEGPLVECRTCHWRRADGTIVSLSGQRMPVPPAWLKRGVHRTGWKGGHARDAGRNSAYCANCHLEAECRDCHSGRRTLRNMHPGDWVHLHGKETSFGNPNCTTCHRTQGFCITCHRRAGVAPDAPTAFRGRRPGTYHRGLSPARICRKARRQITACVSCHSEASCLQCHGRIRPHPPGFSRRCGRLASRNDRACVKCHGDRIPRCD